MKSSLTNIIHLNDDIDDIATPLIQEPLEIEKEKSTEKKLTKKKKKRKGDDTNLYQLENQVFVEFVLNDFKDFNTLKGYKNLKELSLISQNIKNLVVKLIVFNFNTGARRLRLLSKFRVHLPQPK